MPYGLWLTLLAAALVVFTLPPEIHNERLKTMLPFFNSNGAFKFVVEFALGIASSVLIVSARNMEGFKRVLTVAPITWLGKVSYSLYLIHLPILFFLFRALLGKIDFWYIVVLVVSASLLGSELFYQLIERPAMQLGRAIAKKIT